MANSKEKCYAAPERWLALNRRCTYLTLALLLSVALACSGDSAPADTNVQPTPDISPDTNVVDIASTADLAADTTTQETVSVPDPGQPADLGQTEDEGQPSDAGPMTYLGGWTKATCQNETVGTGTKQGDIAYDFQQMDQYGETLRLHDFCDRVVLLVGSAYW